MEKSTVNAPPQPIKKKLTLGTIGSYLFACALITFSCVLINNVFLPALPVAPKPTATRSAPTRISITPTPNTSMRLAFPECYNWSEITTKMVGETVCVYGIVYDSYSTNEAWTRIRFTEKSNSFFMYDSEFIYPDVQPGWCVFISGEVELIENIPYIKIDEGMSAGIPPKTSDCQ